MDKTDDKPFTYREDEKQQAKEPKVSKEQALNELWRQGVLFYKLYKYQLSIYEQINKSDSPVFVLNCSRRLGKSTILCLMALEHAIQNPSSKIIYAAPQKGAAKNIIQPIINKLLTDCPEWLKPSYKTRDQKYHFTNGSEIQIVGTDAERAEAIRGQEVHRFFFDEAGFMSDLKYVVDDIALPATLTSNGRVIIASTPPKTADHPFKRYAESAERTGDIATRTIYDNKTLSDKQIARYMMTTDPDLDYEKALDYVSTKSGPPNNTTWWREYMARFLTDSEVDVIPEFNDEKEKILVQPIERPQFFDTYVAMDDGVKDFTAILFGYWDFLESRLVVEDEVLLRDTTTDIIAAKIKEKERELWAGKPPHARYSDINHQLINDLNIIHDLTFSPVTSKNLEGDINNLRVMIAHNQVLIDPKCKSLISHLKHGIWDKNKRRFARSSDYGHFDALAALIYMAKLVDKRRNPIPSNQGLDIYTQHIDPNYGKNSLNRTLSKAFDPKKFFPED